MTNNRAPRFLTVRNAGVALCAASLSAPHLTIANAALAGPPSALTVVDPARLDGEIAARLEELSTKQGAWQWSDLIDRGRIAIGEGDFAGAAISFEAATQSAPDAATRVMSKYCWGNALISAAQVLPPNEKKDPHPRRLAMLTRAGCVLNAAQFDAPRSRDVAAARLTAWSSLGDGLETMTAEHQMRDIDPLLEGIPRCEPMTLFVIALVVCAGGGIVLRRIDTKGYIEPEQRLMLLKIFDRGAMLAGSAVLGVPWSGSVDAADVFTTGGAK